MRCSILDKTLADILDYLLKTVNESLSALGACLKAKTFGWLLARGCLSKNEKNTESISQVNFSQVSQNFFQNSYQN